MVCAISANRVTRCNWKKMTHRVFLKYMGGETTYSIYFSFRFCEIAGGSLYFQNTALLSGNPSNIAIHSHCLIPPTPRKKGGYPA